MLAITTQQIADAKDNDLSAITHLLSELEPRIRYHANDAATVGGTFHAERADDYAQVARIAVFEAVKTFKGSAPGEFSNYITDYITDAINQERRIEARGGAVYGVSDGVMRTYERALSRAGGDHAAAEKLAQSEEAFGSNRLSPTNAREARWVSTPPVSTGSTARREEYLAEMMSRTQEPDEEGESRSEKRERVGRQVRYTLGTLSQFRARVLRCATGIDDEPDIGFVLRVKRDRTTGELVETTELADLTAAAEYLGTEKKPVSQAWIKGGQQFATKWTEQYGDWA